MTDLDPGPFDIWPKKSDIPDFLAAVLVVCLILSLAFCSKAEAQEYGVLFKCPASNIPSGLTANDPQVISGAVAVYLGQIYPEDFIRIVSKENRPIVIRWLKVCLDYELKEET